MTCPAWRLRDPGRLLFGSPLRGSYVQVPGMDGELPVPLRGTSAQWSLDMMMAGRWDHTGAEFADEQEGFESNLNYLRTNVEPGTNQQCTSADSVDPPGVSNVAGRNRLPVAAQPVSTLVRR